MRKATSARRGRWPAGSWRRHCSRWPRSPSSRTPAEASWLPQPAPAAYGHSEPVAASVTMDDGVVLSAQVVYPTDLVTVARAPGTFPVLLTQNPYGTSRDPTTAGGYFVERGYIYIAASIRGTGTSGGQTGWFGARQGRDGATLVSWAAHALAGSDGNVGLDGCSYLGVDQWYTAAEVGPGSALKVIAPFCTDSEMYNDLATVGGVPTSFIASIARALPRGPADNAQTDPLSGTVNDLKNGGARSYDNEYWHRIDVQQLMPRIVANGVPALSEAGWSDLFPGGNIGAYVAAQNASFGRPVTAPIAAGQRATGRYQAIVGPWTHGNEDVLANIRKEWFDTWLKGRPTGMADTAKPLHIFQNGGNLWVDTAAWPPATSTGTYYLNAAGSLTPTPPATTGADTLSYANPDRPLTYTTAPLTRASVLDGPIDVHLFLRSTTRDAYVAATVNLVSPSGVATKVSDGGLLASMRELDPRQSWYGRGGALIKPSHPFTQASRLSSTTMLFVGMVGAVAWGIFTLLAGRWSDTWGQRRTYLVGTLALAAWTFPFFLLFDTRSVPLLLLAVVVLAFGLGLTYGPQAAAYAELFPTAIRYSGVSFAYAFGAVLGGGFAPLVAAWLVGLTGTSLSVSAYMLVACLVTLAAVLALRERPAAEREAFVVATD